MRGRSIVLAVAIVAVVFAGYVLKRHRDTGGAQVSSALPPETVQKTSVVPAPPAPEPPQVTPLRVAAQLPSTEPVSPPPAPIQDATARPDKPIIPGSLGGVMGSRPDADYFTRIRAVHALGENLSDAEIKALLWLLDRRAGEDPLPLDQLNALKNDTANLLKRYPRIHLKLSRELIRMYRDQSCDQVWRDYCIQHLGVLYADLVACDRHHSPSAVLWEAAQETDSSIGGTALIALTNNADAPCIGKDRVAACALAVCQAPTTGEATLITALQICARLGEAQVLPIARSLAEGKGTVQLRMSALAAIGALGTEDTDAARIERYVSSSDVYLRTAATAARKQLASK